MIFPRIGGNNKELLLKKTVLEIYLNVKAFKKFDSIPDHWGPAVGAKPV